MVAVEWSLALMGLMMAVHGVKVQVRRLFSRETGGRCDGPQRRARVGRFAAAQKGERIVVRGAATATSASRIGIGLWRRDQRRLARARATEGLYSIVLYCIIKRGRAEACAGEGCCELGEGGPHTRTHTHTHSCCT